MASSATEPLVAIDERWLPVVGYEGAYEVSDQGRVRSLDRWLAYRHTRRLHRGRVLSPGRRSSGHLVVSLHKKTASRSHYVHQLVLRAFAGPRPSGQEVRHLDGVPTNNRLGNLVYGTRTENKYDEVRHGVHGQASKTHCPKGHAYDELNTYSPPSRPTARNCRTCQRERDRLRVRP